MRQKYFRLLVSALFVIGTALTGSVFGQLIKTTAPVTALVGTQYVYDVNIYPLGDSTFYLDEKPAGMVINADNGRITWTPTNLNQGGKVVVRATAGTTFSDSQTFYVYVSDAVVCDASMLAYWKLNETTGTTFIDFKNGYNAVTGVAPDDTIGVVGMGQKFDPARDIRLSSADNSNRWDWAQGTDFSGSIWFRSNHDISSSDGPQIFAGRLGATGGTEGQNWWWFGLDTNNYVAAAFSNIGTLTTGEPGYPNEIANHSAYGIHFNDNKWHHAVFTLDGNASDQYTLKIYVDGVLSQAATVTKTLLPGDFAGAADLNIGWWANPWGANFEYKGLLDELALYTKVLTPAEITEMYNDGKAGLAYCQPGNYAPLFISSPVTAATEDVVYTYEVETSDYDAGDDLTITEVIAPDWITSFTDHGNGTATISGTPRNADVGNHSVTIRVSDTKVNVDQVFTIAVANSNDAPTFTSTAITSINEDAVYTYNITTEDLDAGSSVSISATTTLPSWLTLTDNGNKTATLTGTPHNADVGTVNVTLRVTDNTSATADQSFVITVLNVNDAPEITGQADLSTDEDENLVLSLNDLTVTDVDNNYPADFTLEVIDGDNYTFSGNTITPNENWFGTLSVNITLSDLETSVDGTVDVVVNSINDLPQFTSTPVTTATVGAAYEYWIAATDVEDQVLTFEAVTVPSWATFTYNTTLKLGLLQGTPPTNAQATANVSLKVTDGNDAIDTQEFVITVSGGVGIDDEIAAEYGLVVYPSPVKDKLYIQTAKEINNGLVQIMSLSGAVVKEAVIDRQSVSDIDLSALKSGLYLYRISIDGKQIRGKITKE